MAQYRSAYTGQQIDTAIDTVYNLAEVATSGDYNDLINKPSIPSNVVTSVNSKTGDVTLTASDVGASATGHTHTSVGFENPFSSSIVTANSSGVSIDVSSNGGSTQNLFSMTDSTTTIRKVVTPTADGDAANKKYVDDAVAVAGSVSDVQVNGTSILSNKVANLVTNTAYNSSTNKIATMSDVGTMTIRT